MFDTSWLIAVCFCARNMSDCMDVTTSRIERSMFLYQWSLWFNRTKYPCASVWQLWQTVVVRHRTLTCLALSAYVASRQSTSMQRRRAIDMRIACKDSSDHVHLTSRCTNRKLFAPAGCRSYQRKTCVCQLLALSVSFQRDRWVSVCSRGCGNTC